MTFTKSEIEEAVEFWWWIKFYRTWGAIGYFCAEVCWQERALFG